MGKSAAKKAKRMSKRVMFDALIDLFQRNSDRALTYSRIWKELHLTTHPQKMLCADIIGDLLIEGSLVETSNGHFRLVFQQRELVGTIRYDELDLFLKPYGERYMFGPHNRVALIRPVEKLGLQPGQRAINRMNNLADIVAYKLTSAPQGISVNRSDDVKFTFVISNIGKSTKTVEIEDEISPLLKLVSACGME